jgi:hypothetical protein
MFDLRLDRLPDLPIPDSPTRSVIPLLSLKPSSSSLISLSLPTNIDLSTDRSTDKI